MKSFYRIALLWVLLIFVTTEALALPLATTTNVKTKLANRSLVNVVSETEWEAEPYEVSAQRDYVTNTRAMSNEFCFIAPIIRGYPSGVLIPTLTVYYFNSAKRINPLSVSIWVNNTLYDFVIKSTVEAIGSRTFEKASIHLDNSTVEVVSALVNAPNFSVRIVGDFQYNYSFVKENDSAAFNPLDTSTFFALASFVDLLEICEMRNYLLWDLNAGALAGDTSDCSIVDLATTEINLIQLGEDGVMSIGDKGDMVKNLQTLLRNKHFTFNLSDGIFRQTTQRAVLVAQHYYGIPETGNATPTLLYALLNDTKYDIDYSVNSLKREVLLFDKLQIELQRYWFSTLVTPRRERDAFSSKRLDNSDNEFLLIDGIILSTQFSPVVLNTELEIVLYIDGNAVAHMMPLCEADRGTVFDMKILPYGTTRILFYCEVSKGLIASSKQLTVMVRDGIHEYSISLEQINLDNANEYGARH